MDRLVWGHGDSICSPGIGLLCGCLLLMAFLLSSCEGVGPERPNIVLIVADDFGWQDMGFMGSPIVGTPNLDALARSGVTFTKGFNTSGACQPSVRSLMTGLQPIQWWETLRRYEASHPNAQGERFLDVARMFAPLPVLGAPLAEDEVCGAEALRAHGELIFGDIAPEALLCSAPRVQFVREGKEYIAIVPLPNADPSNIDVVKVDDEINITTGSRRRSLKLPRRFVPLSLISARLEGRAMRLSFAAEAASPGVV